MVFTMKHLKHSWFILSLARKTIYTMITKIKLNILSLKQWCDQWKWHSINWHITVQRMEIWKRDHRGDVMLQHSFIRCGPALLTGLCCFHEQPANRKEQLTGDWFVAFWSVNHVNNSYRNVSAIQGQGQVILTCSRAPGSWAAHNLCIKPVSSMS